MLTMSTDIIFANSDGSVTASALVARAQAWMGGARTVNGLSFQLSRPGSATDLVLHIILAMSHRFDGHHACDQEYTLDVTLVMFSYVVDLVQL